MADDRDTTPAARLGSATEPAALEVTCLGTSDAFGSAGRHCAGYLVRGGSATIVLDAGPSILSTLGREGIDSGTIDAIALSHLHGDHFAGVPFVLLDGAFGAPRTRPLTIVGPPGTERRVAELYRVYYDHASQVALPFNLRFVEITDHQPVEIADIRIEAFDVVHQATSRSLGFRLYRGGRSIAYSGDTEWHDALARHVAGTDLFLCECTTLDAPTTGHVNYRVFERHRRDLDCGHVVLTHLGRQMRARGAEIPETMADDGLLLRVGAASPGAARA